MKKIISLIFAGLLFVQASFATDPKNILILDEGYESAAEEDSEDSDDSDDPDDYIFEAFVSANNNTASSSLASSSAACSSLANSTELKKMSSDLGDDSFIQPRMSNTLPPKSVETSRPQALVMDDGRQKSSDGCCAQCGTNCCNCVQIACTPCRNCTNYIGNDCYDDAADCSRSCCIKSSDCMRESVCCVVTKYHGEPCATCMTNTGCWLFCCPFATYFCCVKAYNKCQRHKQENAYW